MISDAARIAELEAALRSAQEDALRLADEGDRLHMEIVRLRTEEEVFLIPTQGDLQGALRTHEHNGDAERAALVRKKIEAYRPLREYEAEYVRVMDGAAHLRAAARFCPDLSEALLQRSEELTARAKMLRKKLGAECAKIEARRLP